MLIKKIDRAAHFLAQHQKKFRCPFCSADFTAVDGHSMVCQNGHRFDLSKKGTLYFLRKAVQTDYDTEMFSSRQKVITSGIYDPVLMQLLSLLKEESPSSLLVDAGCGEGSFLNRLSGLGLKMTTIGFDLSKEGILLASRSDSDTFWCVADMTNLPFGTGQVDCLLNFLSPAHYGEFKRVLSKQGRVIKVIPESEYLKELRLLFYQENDEKQHYSNEKVYRKFQEEWTVTHDERVTYTSAVPSDLQQDVLKMSPLQWGGLLPEDSEDVCQEVTIDLRILVGEK